jgi:hypothetical protein
VHTIIELECGKALNLRGGNLYRCASVFIYMYICMYIYAPDAQRVLGSCAHTCRRTQACLSCEPKELQLAQVILFSLFSSHFPLLILRVFFLCLYFPSRWLLLLVLLLLTLGPPSPFQWSFCVYTLDGRSFARRVGQRKRKSREQNAKNGSEESPPC